MPLLLALLLASPECWALELDLGKPHRSIVLGAQATFSAKAEGAVGPVELRWDFGDGEQTEFLPLGTLVQHTYQAPGRYPVIALARDEVSRASSVQMITVHYEQASRAQKSSSTMVQVEELGLICCANTDQASVSCIDTPSLEKSFEIPVHSRPTSLSLAPNGTLWVVHDEDFSVAVIDLEQKAIVRRARLPYASSPQAILVSEAGVAWISLGARGEILGLDVESLEELARIQVDPFPRGLALLPDGNTLLVSHFISPDAGGRISRIFVDSGEVTEATILPPDDTSKDTDQSGRGLPNYLFSIGLSPDGRSAWVPSKKDNIFRGLSRDGQAMTPDNTVRPLVTVLDLAGSAPLLSLDLDDRNLPLHVSFSPLGDLAFVSVFGSNSVEIRDGYHGGFVTALRNVGRGARASLLDAQGRLYVEAFLDRSIKVWDVHTILEGTDLTAQLLADLPLVEEEALAPEVLLGKRIFYDSEDKRMTNEGYVSCGSCHFEGFEDGRVWDFSDRGEGLRNTISLLGRSGMGHGRLHWTGNFDEVQDFEGDIRNAQGGLGFMEDELYFSGSTEESLGDSKAGKSAALDALAAYVSSLDRVARSPFKQDDGSFTERALHGEALFSELGCETCHKGPERTDSSQALRHSIGTEGPASGERLGEKLDGFDTPTLLGVFQTAPYFHDGSARTLKEALSRSLPGTGHESTARLAEGDLEDLIRYLLELDGQGPPPELPETKSPKRAPMSSPQGSCQLGPDPNSKANLLWLSLALLVGRRRWRRTF